MDISIKRKKIFALALAALFALLVQVVPAYAVTKAEMLAALWDGLDYKAAPEMRLPPDVQVEHRFAKPIGYAVRYGLVPRAENFFPDDEINRHEAVRLTLMMIGWGFELSLYESLATLPDFGGSGDSVFFLAAEMKPTAPQSILVDGATPLSDSAKNSLVDWAVRCKKFVQWNRVFTYGGTDLILFRQGAARPGEPNEPKNGNPVGAPECEPLYVAAIAAHPSEVDQRIAFAEPAGAPRVTPSDFSRAYDAIGVVNGGFFAGARPLGTMLTDGTHAGKPLVGRSAVGWSNTRGTFVFGRGNARIGARTPGGFVEFSNFNVAPQPDEASLYSSLVTSSSIGTALDALQVLATNGVVTELREGADNNHWLPEGSIMIVARGRARSGLGAIKPGDRVEIVTEWETGSFGECSDMLQAGPMLLKGGRFMDDAESFKADVTEKRHPRTIVGTDGRRMIWAVVDGRSAIHSRGATMEETKWIAKSLGMTTALNLDGGGSSQAIWRGILTNSPSDGKERPLPYAVLMMPKGAEMVRRNTYDLGEFGSWGYTTDGEQEAVYMDVYNPLEDAGKTDM